MRHERTRNKTSSLDAELPPLLYSFFLTRVTKSYLLALGTTQIYSLISPSTELSFYLVRQGITP